MSRPLRIQYPGAWYHVMNRGSRSNAVFLRNQDYKAFIDILKESAELWKVNIAAYCLMSNHYHLLIQTPEANLSRSMRHINGVYTQRFNKMHGSDGPLFRGRYKSILIDADSYLLEVVRYIHRNPLRAGIARSIGAYPWSSHHGYLSEAKDWAWLYKDFIFSLFASHRDVAKTEYVRFISQGDREELNRFYFQQKGSSVLGTDGFITWLKGNFSADKRDREIPEAKLLLPDVDTIKKSVCSVYGVGESQMQASRRGTANEPRNMAIYLTRYLRGDSLADIGREFGIARYSSVSSAVERMKKELSRDPHINERMERIKTIVSKSQEQT